MKKRSINAFAAIYIIFALLAAHTALAPDQTALAGGSGQGTIVAVTDDVVRDNSRLDVDNTQADSYFDGIDDAARKGEYTIVCWTADWCSGCKVWKRDQAPALLKMGYKVVYKDYHKDSPPKDVKLLPTIIVMHKSKAIGAKPAWKAKDINKFILNHLTRKGR
jgi:hypothetical protein